MRAEGTKSRKGSGGNMGGAITRDGEGKEEKRKRIGIHPT